MLQNFELQTWLDDLCEGMYFRRLFTVNSYEMIYFEKESDLILYTVTFKGG